MHQTTIRFGSDLWEALAVGASAEGVSVAQYVRESAVERLARTGRPELGEPIAATDRRRDARAPRRVAGVLAGGSSVVAPGARPARPPAAGNDLAGGRGGSTPSAGGRAGLFQRGVAGRSAAARHTESSAAVWAQSRLARARAQELRAASQALIAARRAARAGTPAPAAASPQVRSGDASGRASRAAT